MLGDEDIKNSKYTIFKTKAVLTSQSNKFNFYMYKDLIDLDILINDLSNNNFEITAEDNKIIKQT